MLGYIRSIVKDLNRTIYVGDRLESNMRALTFVSVVSTLLGVVETFVSQGSKDEIDITTGIMSRNAGEKAIARVMQEEKGCLVFMDVDNLKRINDTYGHEAGDRILHMMGDTLTENSSGSLCCRLGGDEFLLFMKNVSEQEAGDRIFRGYFKMNGSGSLVPRYSVADFDNSL